jgi:hypothetical protein
MMDPASQDETKLLIPIDGEENAQVIRKKLEALHVTVRLDSLPKNGRHIITAPCNPALLPEAEIKKRRAAVACVLGFKGDGGTGEDV